MAVPGRSQRMMSMRTYDMTGGHLGNYRHRLMEVSDEALVVYNRCA
jgi:hypothetical protein